MEVQKDWTLALAVKRHLSLEGKANLEYVQQFDCVKEAIGKILKAWEDTPYPSPASDVVENIQAALRTIPNPEVMLGGTSVKRKATSIEVEKALQEVQAWHANFTDRVAPLNACMEALNSPLVTGFFAQLHEKKILLWSAPQARFDSSTYSVSLTEPMVPAHDGSAGLVTIERGFIAEDAGHMSQASVDSLKVKSLVKELRQIIGQEDLLLRLSEKVADALKQCVQMESSLTACIEERSRTATSAEKMRVKILPSIISREDS